VEGSCEHGNEASGSIKCWEALECCTTGGFSRTQLHEVVSYYLKGCPFYFFFKHGLSESGYVPASGM
jgi:hypothetical protein